MVQTISIIIFLAGYIAISQEKIFKINKTAISLILAVILWLLISFSGLENSLAVLSESAAEIFSLVIFLLSAMTLVEILTHYGLFDFIYSKLLKVGLKDKLQFFVITTLAFFFSAILDNLTTTIVFLQISTRFFSGRNLLKTASAVVVAANAGGVFSPIGDVSTTMLWLANKFTVQTIFTQTFLPSLTIFLVSIFLIGRSIDTDTKDRVHAEISIGKIEWFVIALCMLSFLLPFLMTVLHLPPYFGLLLGLGVVWLVVDLAKLREPNNTSLSESIESFFQKTDVSSLYFFIGILLSIAALAHQGILDQISHKIFTEAPSTAEIIRGNIALGVLSSFFDNIPLTAAAIDIVKTTNQNLWAFLALTVGVGGSLLLIGSAPGIIAMTLVKDLTFDKYFKIATLPVLVAFSLGIAVWYLQFTYF